MNSDKPASANRFSLESQIEDLHHQVSLGTKFRSPIRTIISMEPQEIRNEYALIQEKKSRLSATTRKLLCAMVEREKRNKTE